MTKLGPIPTPESGKNVNPIKIGKGVLSIPGKTHGVQSPPQTVAPGVTGTPKTTPAPTGPTLSVERIVVGKNPSPILPSQSYRPTTTPPVSFSVEPQRMTKGGTGQLGRILPSPKPASYPSGPVRFAPTPGHHYAPKDRSGIVIVGRFEPLPWGEVPPEAYLAKAFEALGITVYRFDQYVADGPPMQAAWALFTDDNFSWSRIGEWSRTHPTILWTQQWTPDHIERLPLIEAARSATIFMTADRFDWAGAFGIGHHFYLPGACEPVNPTFEPKPTRNCAFVGQLYTSRRRRIAEIVRSCGGEVLDKPKSRPYGAELAKFAQATKVMVEDAPKADVLGYWSSDNYIIPGAGGFLLTSDANGIRKDFEPGVHLATYASIEGFEKSLRAYVENDDVREKIRRAGFIHVRNRHTWAERAKALLAKMNSVPSEVKV